MTIQNHRHKVIGKCSVCGAEHPIWKSEENKKHVCGKCANKMLGIKKDGST